MNIKTELNILFKFICEEFDRNFLLLGGYLLGNLFTKDARLSSDIDIHLYTFEADVRVKQHLNNIATNLIKEFPHITYKIREPKDGTHSWGLMFFKNERFFIGVDIQVLRHSSAKLSDYTEKIIDGQYVYCYTIENIVADKLRALLSHARYRRAKDLYDLYIILLNSDINTQAVQELLEPHMSTLQICFDEESLEKMFHAYDKLTLFGIETEYITKPEFAKVYNYFSNLVTELLQYARNWHKDSQCFLDSK